MHDATPTSSGVIVDPRAASAAAGLSYVSDEEPGIRRVSEGEGFAYLDPKGRPIRDKSTLERVRKLAIPPAYSDVWICPDVDGHIQATGRDAKGRKQYRYHPRWREVRDSTKFDRMLEFARALPRIRARVGEDMARRGLPREKVLATVVHLLETTLVRVGNDEYARDNKSYGLTTLRDRHVKVEKGELRFLFKGKSGKEWRLAVKDRRIAKVVRACQDLPGQSLFQYLDEDGETQKVGSSDVNAYLREISGMDITAKDFRTWAGTVLAAAALVEVALETERPAKKAVKAAVERVAALLGNTPTICRKCYVHPEIFALHAEGALGAAIEAENGAPELAGLRPEEAAVLGMLEQRLGRDLKQALAASLDDAVPG